MSKYLQLLADMKGCRIVPIKYRFKNYTFKGYDLVKVIDGIWYIQYSFEPVQYSNGDRWMIIDKRGSGGIVYSKNMQQAACTISYFLPKVSYHVLQSPSMQYR